jgi:hypothetical protein
MAAVPMLAGVGLMMVCCSSLSSFMMMGGEEKEDPVVPKTPAKKTPEQIEADKAKAALDVVKADPDATPAEVAAAQVEADNAQAAADADADADDSTQDYTESCDDLGGGVIVRHESGKDLGVCKTECSDDLDCLGIIHKVDVGFCQLHDNKDPYGVDICGQGYTVHRDATGKTSTYSQSCDDLGGNVIVRHESGKDLSDCKTECSADASCKGFIHKTSGFCQLHDNNDPYGVDICGQGYKVYRK